MARDLLLTLLQMIGRNLSRSVENAFTGPHLPVVVRVVEDEPDADDRTGGYDLDREL